MSKLGKTLLWVALVGAIVAVGAGIALIGKYNDTKTTLVQSQAQEKVDQQKISKDKKEYEDLSTAKADVDSKLTAETSKADDLNTQLTAAKQQAADAATAVQKANDAAKTAQDQLDAINKTLDGKTADQIKADTAKAQADLAAALSEQKILQDQLQASQSQVGDLKDSLYRSKTGTQPPGISGKVTFIDHTWNFVILNVGLSNGVVPNGEMWVYRGRSLLGKIRITKADTNDAVAEILPDNKGDIQVGDSVVN
jgi:hypothetical protein